jgi:hypothetical protein
MKTSKLHKLSHRYYVYTGGDFLLLTPLVYITNNDKFYNILI